MKLLSGVAPVLAVIAGVVFVCNAGEPGRADEPLSGAGSGQPAPSHVEHDPPGPGQVFGGIPESTRDESGFTLIDNGSFDVGYSEFRQEPVWVGYFVGPDTIRGKMPRPRTFSTDSRTAARVAHRDYSRTGYDRGHMAPNHAIATRYGREGQAETFRMSNIVPQKPALNRQVWRRLEELEADRWAVEFGGVWVITGPVFDDDRQYLKRAAPRIDIPDAFFKVIVDEPPAGASDSREPRLLAFVIPQDVAGDETLGEFLVSVDWIEDKTGLDLMPDLPDDVENAVESAVADGLW